jgi:hypothetical protein
VRADSIEGLVGRVCLSEKVVPGIGFLVSLAALVVGCLSFALNSLEALPVPVLAGRSVLNLALYLTARTRPKFPLGKG